MFLPGKIYIFCFVAFVSFCDNPRVSVSKTKATKAGLIGIENALEFFYQKENRYVKNAEGIEYLVAKGIITKHMAKDAWGNRWSYKALLHTDGTPKNYMLRSLGKDGLEDTADDLDSISHPWTKKQNTAQNRLRMFFEDIKHGNLSGVKNAIKFGVDPNSLNKHGVTAIAIAAGAGNLNIVRLLVKSGANVNKQNLKGGTALMKAVYKKNKEIILFLLKNGADVKAKDENGYTAIRLARIGGSAEIIKILGDAR